MLAAFYVRRQRHKNMRALVVAKRRICHQVWPKEVRKWGFPFTVTVLHHNRRAVDDGADIHLINYESLPWLMPLVKSGKVKYDMLVIDESSQIRNSRTGRFKNLRKMMNRFSFRYILTGSPAPRGLMGLWAQCFIMDGGATFGDSIVRFRNRYYYPAGFKGKEYELQEDGEERIYDALKKRVLHTGQDQLKNMPREVMLHTKISLPPEVRMAYDMMKHDLVMDIAEGIITAANSGVAMGKLRQICNGAVYYQEQIGDKKPMRRVERLHDVKAQALKELVDEVQGVPVLVAVEYHHDRLAINEVFGYDVPFLGGGVSDEDSEILEDKWNDGKIPVLLAQPETAAHGLNLQDAGNVVVFYSIPWDYEMYEQFYQRVLRQGQKEKRVLIYHIVAEDTQDEDSVSRLRERGDVQQRLFKALENTAGEYLAMAGKKKVTKKRTSRGDTATKPKVVPKGFKAKAKPEVALKALYALATTRGEKDAKGNLKCFELETYDDGEFTEYSVGNWWLGAMQVLGAASVEQHQKFQRAVLAAKDVVKGDSLGDNYRFSKAGLLSALGATISDTGVTNMKDPALLSEWPNKRNLGSKPEKRGDSAMAAKKTSKKKATKKKVSKKAASGGGGKKMGQLTPLGTADWGKLPGTTKLKACGKKDMPGEPNAAIQSVLDVIKGKTMTVDKLLEAGVKKGALWPAVNRSYLIVQKK